MIMLSYTVHSLGFPISCSLTHKQAIGNYKTSQCPSLLALCPFSCATLNMLPLSLACISLSNLANSVISLILLQLSSLCSRGLNLVFWFEFPVLIAPAHVLIGALTSLYLYCRLWPILLLLLRWLNLSSSQCLLLDVVLLSDSNFLNFLSLLW